MAEISSFFFLLVLISSSAIIVKSIRLQNTRRNNIEGRVTSIQTLHGEIYDCIDVHKQPSLSHPTLHGHKVKLRPDPKLLAKLSFRDGNDNDNHIQFNLTNLWKLGKGCPEGSVPIAREVMNNLKIYLPGLPGEKAFHGIDFAGLVSRPNFKTFYAAGAHINIQNPNKLPGDEYSSASVYVESLGSDFNQIVAGWTVNPTLYKDDYRTRFYTKWKGRAGSGCYNLQCPGFIQTNKAITVDLVLDHTSVQEGVQYEIRTYVFLEEERGWWLVLGDGLGVLIGYWPLSLFSSMRQSANKVRFGGEVLTAPDKSSSPPMGSGKFLDGQYDKTCHMRRVVVDKDDRHLVDGDDSFLVSMDSRCYFSQRNPRKTPNYGYSFFFGGGGGKPDMCLG